MIKAFKILLIGLLLFSCKKPTLLEKEGEQIFSLVARQVEFGARTNNSKNKEKCLEWIKRQGSKLGYEVAIDRWSENVKGSKRHFANIIITKKALKPTEKFIILGTHYDTKIIAGKPNFISANDGGSSTGALIFLMKKLKNWDNQNNIQFVFFDGEECFGGNNDYRRHYEGELNGLHGSTRYAHKILYSGRRKNCKAMLLMDMIGDKNLHITFPRNNSSKLVSKALEIAKREKFSAHFSRSKNMILDDHVPFHEIGVPTINFIDFEYGENNKYWHTEEDTLDKLSPRNLAISAYVFTQLLKEVDKQ